MPDNPVPETSDDRFFGGRLILRQPRQGYRAGIDPIFLASAIPSSSRSILDLGCGAGAAALCALARLGRVSCTGVEREPVFVALARHNAHQNGFADRINIIEADIGPSFHGAERFDTVIMNPPFFSAEAGYPSPVALKSAAHHGPDNLLSTWLAVSAALLAPGGQVIVILHPDQLGALMATIARDETGAWIYPLFPADGQAASRVIVLLRPDAKGRQATKILPGMVLHHADGRYTMAAERILRGAAALPIPNFH